MKAYGKTYFGYTCFCCRAVDGRHLKRKARRAAKQEIKDQKDEQNPPLKHCGDVPVL